MPLGQVHIGLNYLTLLNYFSLFSNDSSTQGRAVRTTGSLDPEYQIPNTPPSNWHREDDGGGYVSSGQPIEKQGQRYLFSQPCPQFGPPFTVAMVLCFCDSFNVCL